MNTHDIICNWLLCVGFMMFYDCRTFNGSSGSPVVKVVDGKLQVVAIHRGILDSTYYNCSTLFSAVFSHLHFDDKEGLVAYNHYINIAVPSAFSLRHVMINDRPVDVLEFRPIRFSSNKIWGYGAHLKIDPGIQVVEHQNRNAVLSVVVYGFTSAMSYGYFGGLYFASTNASK